MLIQHDNLAKAILNLKEGKEGVKPEYAKCVDIATVGALRELLPASTLAIVVTLVVGFIGGIKALGGYLAGSIFSGLLFALLMANVSLLVLTVAIGFLGKILGTLAIRPFSNLSARQVYLIGWGMNSQGAVELVISLLALKHGLIAQEVFSALVAMVTTTTLVFPFVLQREIKHDPKTME